MIRAPALPGAEAYLAFEVDPRLLPAQCPITQPGVLVGEDVPNGALCLESELGVLWPVYNQIEPTWRVQRP